MRRAGPLLALALAGCTVGPRYAGPPAAAGAAAFSRAGDVAVSSAPPLARWWDALADPTLSELERRALAANPDLAAAAARLAQARARLGEQRANGTPKLSASSLYAHARFPGLDLNNVQSGQEAGGQAGAEGGGGSSALDLYNLGFNASWEVDLFGGQRRAVEAARATAESAEASLADAQVSLTAEVARDYVALRDAQHRLALDRRAVTLQERALALVQQRFDRGTASRLDVQRATQQLEGARADVTPVAAQLDGDLDALATLTGAEPGALDAMLAAPAPLPLPPAHVPIGDPAGLIRRRPDIRAAERTLAANTAKIGQAQAARFPSLQFAGIFGIGGTRPSDLTHLDDFTALLAPQLSWSFLDFGRTRARVEEARGARDEAEAKYRSTVLGALRDAEDALSQFRNRRGTVATLARIKASADAAAALARERYAAGTGTLTEQLEAEIQQADAEANLSQAEAGLTGDFVLVQKALGLGWGPAA